MDRHSEACDRHPYIIIKLVKDQLESFSFKLKKCKFTPRWNEKKDTQRTKAAKKKN